MSARPTRLALALVLASLALPAHATFHLMKIVAVFTGTPAAPQAQYVEIQAYASGQGLLSGHAVTVFNAAGQQVGAFTFSHNMSNSANQMHALIATSQAASFFNVTPDMTMSAAMLAGGGKVCWAGTIDCVAWGAYTGASTGVGTPFNAAGGITPGRAAVRRLDLSGSATTLDAGDDTDNSAHDFVFGTPAPRNNAGMIGHAPGNTCGNGVIEGLEQCDDHNVASGDGCSSTCTVEQGVSTRHAATDFDGDGHSDVFWRNTGFGNDAIWRSANSATAMAAPTVSDQRWQVVATGDFDGDLKSDAVWRHSATGANVLWRSGNAATSVALTAVTNPAWHIIGAGDFDGDGKQDLLWRNVSNGANAIWRSANASTPLPMLGVSNLDWQIVGTGDFNHDGRSDVLWRNVRTGGDVIWLSATGSTPQAMTGVTDPNWRIVGTGDFDADGASDVLWRNVATGANAIWRSGNASTSMAVTAVTQTEWQIVAVGDYDGDGKSDIFWRNATTGSDVIWRSANAATQMAVSAVPNAAWKVVPYFGQSLGGVTPAASASLSVLGTSVAEGNSGMHTASFTVQLSKPLSTAVSYDISTADGTAVAGMDYQAKSASQTIAAGQTTGSFTVSVLGDTVVESNETFSVHLSHVVGAAVGNATAIGTISDDDYMYGY